MSGPLDTRLQGWGDVPFDSLGIEVLDEAQFASRFYVGPACELEANFGLRAIFQLRFARTGTVRAVRLRLTFRSGTLERRTAGKRGTTHVVELTVASRRCPLIRNLIMAALLARAPLETGTGSPSLAQAKALYGFPLSANRQAQLRNMLAPEQARPSAPQDARPVQHLAPIRSLHVSRGHTLLPLYGEFAEDHALQIGLEFSFGERSLTRLTRTNPTRVRLQLQDGRTFSTVVESWQWSPRRSLRDAIARACRSTARLTQISRTGSDVLCHVADVLQDRPTVLPQRPQRALHRPCPRCMLKAPWRYGRVFGQPVPIQVPHGRCIDGQLLVCDDFELAAEKFELVEPVSDWQDLPAARAFSTRDDWLRALQDTFWVELAPMTTNQAGGPAHA